MLCFVAQPKSRNISFMDEVITDVGGAGPRGTASRTASRTAAVPGRAPGVGSPQRHRAGGSGMSRGLKAKPPPPKVSQFKTFI